MIRLIGPKRIPLRSGLVFHKAAWQCVSVYAHELFETMSWSVSCGFFVSQRRLRKLRLFAIPGLWIHCRKLCVWPSLCLIELIGESHCKHAVCPIKCGKSAWTKCSVVTAALSTWMIRYDYVLTLPLRRLLWLIWHNEKHIGQKHIYKSGQVLSHTFRAGNQYENMHYKLDTTSVSRCIQEHKCDIRSDMTYCKIIKPNE